MTDAPRDPRAIFRKEAQTLLAHALHELGWNEAVAEVPARLTDAPAGKGDFAYPCFPLTKIARKAPPAIAEDVKNALPADRPLDVTVEGGYVNFTIPDAAIVPLTLESVEAHGAAYGTHADKGQTVIVEHTSANPNGPFHVGRARNPIVGDGLARVLRAAGYGVTTEYYVNDMGKQVAILTWGLTHLTKDDVPPPEREKADHQRVTYYQKANERMEVEPEVAEAINASLKRFEEGDETVAKAFREAADSTLNGMVESLARLNVCMDNFAYESDVVRSGEVEKVVRKLKKSEHAQEDETGSWFLELEPFGIQGKNTKWTFLRRDGTTLYTTRDLAYHEDKFRRANRLVNVLGEDHKLTMQQLAIALDLLGHDRAPEVVWISFVSLPEGKMSTRRGRVVFVDDLMDEAVARAREEVEKRRSDELPPEKMTEIAELVGIGALRFNISRVQTEKSITFKWEEALNFDGDSAPFVQYAHARAASILRKAAGEPLPENPKSVAEVLTHPSEITLVRTLAKLPGVVHECAEGLKIHPVAAYAVEAANAFNAFYRDCPVLIAEDPHVKHARIKLVEHTKQVLAIALDLVGVKAPETM